MKRIINKNLIAFICTYLFLLFMGMISIYLFLFSPVNNILGNLFSYLILMLIIIGVIAVSIQLFNHKDSFFIYEINKDKILFKYPFLNIKEIKEIHANNIENIYVSNPYDIISKKKNPGPIKFATNILFIIDNTSKEEYPQNEKRFEFHSRKRSVNHIFFKGTKEVVNEIKNNFKNVEVHYLSTLELLEILRKLKK